MRSGDGVMNLIRNIELFYFPKNQLRVRHYWTTKSTRWLTLTKAGQHNTHESSGATSHDNPAIPSESQEAFFLDDQFLSDFEWALGDNRLFPPTEPCGPIWSSTTSGL